MLMIDFVRRWSKGEEKQRKSGGKIGARIGKKGEYGKGGKELATWWKFY